MSALEDLFDTVTVKNFAFRLAEASGNPVDYYGNQSATWTGSPTYGVVSPITYEPTDKAITTNGATFSFSGFTDWGTVYAAQPTLSMWIKQPVLADAGVFEWYLDANNFTRIWYDSANTRFELNHRVAGTDYRGWTATVAITDWTCMTFAFPFTGGGSIPRYFANGTDVSFGGYDAAGFPLFAAGSATVTVGGDGVHTNLAGSMDEVLGTNNQYYYAFFPKFYSASIDSPYVAKVKATARYYWRLNEASGDAVSSASFFTLPRVGVLPTYQNDVGPVIGDPNSQEMLFNLGGSFQTSSRQNVFSGSNIWSIQLFMKFPADTGQAFRIYASTSIYVDLNVINATTLRLTVNYYGTVIVNQNFSPDAGGDFVDWRLVTIVMNNGSLDMWIDKYLAHTGTGYNTGSFNVLMDFDIGSWGGTNGSYAGAMSEVSFHQATALTQTDVDEMYTLSRDAPAPDSLNLPMLLKGFLTYAAANLPMRLLGAGLYAQQNMPMQLNGIDSNESAVTALYYDIAVTLDGVEITDLVGTITVEHQERSSGLAKFQFIPPAGAIDPDAFERKSVTVTYRRVTSTGVLIYQSRRFTGTSSSAYYDPDSGIVRVEATTDFQGQVENMTREGIAAVIDTGQWSDHIFDDSADGWQYAQDLMSTTPYDVHVAEDGGLVSIPWAAKATADLELTDDNVEDMAISLTRAKRRDLLTRIKLNIDFRFVRLRHREMAVQLPETYSFCDWLNNGMNLPGKSMVQSAADSSTWTRISDITFNTFPDPGVYCTPSRGWVGGAEEFCLTASWTAARRWAQTVTEEYALYIYSPDMEESVGRQEVNEDYGVEATYDSTDYEKIVEFDAPPTGAVYDPNSEDWTKDATDSEADGRLAMEDAQVVAMARANTTILDRARRNRLSFYPVFNPFITLDKTLRLNTTYAQAKGKIFRLQEKYDMDTGQLLMKTELALSRHGGSGFGADEPQTPPAEPAPPTETPSARTYVLPWRVGGVSSGDPVDDPDWDGYMTNVDVNIRDPAAPIYSQRLVVEMPEIEEAARNATAVQAEQLYTIAVPEDELTMSY